MLSVAVRSLLHCQLIYWKEQDKDCTTCCFNSLTGHVQQVAQWAIQGKTLAFPTECQNDLCELTKHTYFNHLSYYLHQYPHWIWLYYSPQPQPIPLAPHQQSGGGERGVGWHSAIVVGVLCQYWTLEEWLSPLAIFVILDCLAWSRNWVGVIQSPDITGWEVVTWQAKPPAWGIYGDYQTMMMSIQNPLNHSGHTGLPPYPHCYPLPLPLPSSFPFPLAFLYPYLCPFPFPA